MPTPLEQLMRDATALADQLRQERLVAGRQPKSGGQITILEEQLARIWTDIRLARTPRPVASLGARHHSKWE